MDAIRKTLPTAKLKNLPEDQQAQIIERLRTASYRQMCDALAAEGLQTSPTGLSIFWRWWHRKQREGASAKQ